MEEVAVKVKAIDFLSDMEFLPSSREGNKLGRPSKSELKRWLEKGSVIINEEKPSPNDEVCYPIKSLIFFPKGDRVTM